MSIEKLNKNRILNALRITGYLLDWPNQVEIVIVGGAAGVLLDIWEPNRVTEDCDIVEFSPPTQPRRAVLQAATEAADRLGIHAGWLNDDFELFGTLDTLPNSWQKRSVEIGVFGKLRVTALGRQDLLAMKVYAARPQDIEDVYSQLDSITSKDIEFIRQYLVSLKAPYRRNIKAKQLEYAFELLAAIESEVSK